MDIFGRLSIVVLAGVVDYFIWRHIWAHMKCRKPDPEDLFFSHFLALAGTAVLGVGVMFAGMIGHWVIWGN